MMWTETEREQVCAWLRRHDIDPGVVPVDSQLAYDHAAGTWTIDVFTPSGRRTLIFAGREPWPLTRQKEGSVMDDGQLVGEVVEVIDRRGRSRRGRMLGGRERGFTIELDEPVAERTRWSYAWGEVRSVERVDGEAVA